jgi:hypothetical protein
MLKLMKTEKKKTISARRIRLGFWTYNHKKIPILFFFCSIHFVKRFFFQRDIKLLGNMKLFENKQKTENFNS